jgi:predicted nucleic acid-binding protein
MAQRRYYIDSNLIIYAVNPAQTENTQAARAALEDPSRSIVVSDFVELETLPKMRFNKQQDQVEFTEALFRKVEYVNSSGEIIVKATALASDYGLAAMDALKNAIERAATCDCRFQRCFERRRTGGAHV